MPAENSGPGYFFCPGGVSYPPSFRVGGGELVSYYLSSNSSSPIPESNVTCADDDDAWGDVWGLEIQRRL